MSIPKLFFQIGVLRNNLRAVVPFSFLTASETAFEGGMLTNRWM